MITLGSIRWSSSSPEINLIMGYEKQRSGADMQYRITVKVSPVTGSSYFGYPIYTKVTIDNVERVTKTLKDASPNQWASEITYTTPWYTIANKTSGTVPVSINVYSGSGSTRTGTYRFTMPVDPAGSTIAALGGTLGQPMTISVTRYDSSYTDTIEYVCGGLRGTVCTDSKDTSVVWNASNGNTLALSSQNTAGSIVLVTLIVSTYSGGSVVGTNSIPIKMTIPPEVKPSVSMTVSDPTGLADTYGAYIQGHSRFAVTLTPTLAYSSPITKYAINANDVISYAGDSLITGPIVRDGNQLVRAYVTDARGNPSDIVTETVSVLPYAKPTVMLTAERCNEEGVPDPEGAYMRVALGATIASLNDHNRATYVITYRNELGQMVTIEGEGTEYTSDAIECDVANTRTVQVVVTDDLSSTTISTTIPVAFTLFDYHNSGKGVAFGKVATREGFDCAMDSYFGHKRIQEVGSPVESTDAVNLGYAQSIFAPAIKDDTYPSCYYRMMDGVREWINPPMLLGVEYRTTERWLGKPVYTKIVSFGTLPNAAAKSISWTPDSGTAAQVISAVLVSRDGGMLNMIDSANTGAVWVVTNDDYSSRTADVVLKYTKL